MPRSPSPKKKPARNPEALVREGGPDSTDYILQRGHVSCWITVGKISVHVVRQPDKTVKVALYPLGQEADDPIDTACASAS